MKPASAILLQAQIDQHKHDLRAHRDILNLNTYERLKHMTLHFLKYAGKMAEASESADRALLHKTLLDTFIICLATANTLNINIAKNSTLHAIDLKDLAKSMANSSPSPHDIFEESIKTLLKIAGKMAKAVESTDHLERGDPRASLEELVCNLGLETLKIIGRENSEIQLHLEERWLQVEMKSIFFGTPF
jgi:hypothetical protein